MGGVCRSDVDGPLFRPMGVFCNTGTRARHDKKGGLVGGAECVRQNVFLCVCVLCLLGKGGGGLVRTFCEAASQ